MADTTYTDQSTVITADTMNDLNRLHYTIFADAATVAAAKTALGLGTGDSPTFTALTLSNGQIVFPATQVASANANTLDDYEEGTFTPVLAGSATAGTQTYGAQVGDYQKVGNYVHTIIAITLTAKDAATAGNMQLTGLPFAVRNVSGMSGGASIGAYTNFDLSAGYTQLGLYGVAGNTKAQFSQSGDNVAQDTILAAAISATTNFTAQLTYTV